MNGIPYADIIIIALIAVFVILRLRNTLGKDIGHTPDFTQVRKQLDAVLDKDREKPATPSNDKTQAAPEDPALKAELALRESIGDPALLAGIDAIIAADPTFSISGFLEGAKGAFEWVLKAYSAGDVETLGQLLAPPVLKEFQEALEAAKAEVSRVEVTLVAIKDAQITAAALEGGEARVSVRFLSEQIELTRDADNKIIAGDPSKVEAVEDEWSFEREVKSRNPNWLVMDT